MDHWAYIFQNWGNGFKGRLYKLQTLHPGTPDSIGMKNDGGESQFIGLLFEVYNLLELFGYPQSWPHCTGYLFVSVSASRWWSWPEMGMNLKWNSDLS